MKSMLDIDKLATTYSDMVYNIARRYLKTKEDAEDIAQEVCIRYIANTKEGKELNSETHEKSWLIKVTMNLCCNEICSAKRRYCLPFNENIYCEFNIDSENLLNEAVNKLENKYREPFILFYVEGMKITEISEVLRISESNVKTRLKRARDQVRENVKRGEKSFERI